MDKNEIKKECADLILGVKLVHLVLEEAEPGSGDLAIDVIVEELSKLRSKPACVSGLLHAIPGVSLSEEAAPVPHTSGHKQYIGTKLIQAAPALRIETPGGGLRIELLSNAPAPGPNDIVDMGYEVIYPEGYKSWSPQDVFETAYRPTTGMNFGLALEAAKMGKKIARRGWNGKEQYVELGHDFQYDTYDGNGHVVYHEDIGTKALVFVGTRGRQVGWLASQSDMLADDWYIVE